MRLLIYSDLHLECESRNHKFLVPEDLDYDVVVLAGDIGRRMEGIEWAERTFPHKPVIYVNGNHEYHGANVHTLGQKMIKHASGIGHVYFLHDTSAQIRGVRFIGATLWTNFKLFGENPHQVSEAMHHARVSMHDFNAITFRLGESMTPSDSVRLFNESVRFISAELEKPFSGKTVVVTHHLPSYSSVTHKFKKSLLSAAFASDLDVLVKKCDLWIHGHAHESLDYTLDRCRVVCNPRGYPEGSTIRRENPDFRHDMVVEL
jgi:predicted phosphodiesterase